MLQEFRAFLMRGNVLDLAVAVIIGTAFGAIVTSLTEDVIMPVIGAATGGLDFSSYYTVLGPIPERLANVTSYDALKKAGVPLLGYGAFLTAVVRFVILGLIIFWLLRIASRIFRQDVVTPATPPDIALLQEIRDELRARPLPPR